MFSAYFNRNEDVVALGFDSDKKTEVWSASYQIALREY